MSADEDALAAMEANVRAMFKTVEGLKTRVASMGGDLAPVIKEEQALRDGIAASHGGPGKFNRDTAPDRAPKFERLTQIAVEHGRKKQEHQQAKRQVKAYLKEIESTMKLASKLREKMK